jgi:NADH:ubiquinone oxidoreductase subunit 2 (subunit N)
VILSSIVIGCFGALLQKRIKRFIGYTSVNQIGFILLGICSNTITGFNNAYNFVIFYIIVNLIFFIILIVPYQIKNKLYTLIYITDLLNLRKYITFYIYLLFIVIVAIILGIPPSSNFFIKYNLLFSLITQTYY